MASRVSLGSFSVLVLLLAGCSSLSTTASHSPVGGALIQGKVHGGQQPIVGAQVYLYEADNSGYGVASHSLLSSGLNDFVTTDGNGSFTITGDYSCDSGREVYLYALGGSSDGGAHTNSGIGLMAALGPCPGTAPGTSTFSPALFITINEVTTVAAAYAMAGFATDATHVSAPSNPTLSHPLAATGIANAFANAANLVDISNGAPYTTTPALGSVGTVPVAEINTLANFLAACVNSPTASSSPCTSLFNNALPNGGSGGAPPSDTANAILNIAHHPYVSSTVISNLCALQTGVGAPFQPTLPCNGTSPADFTIGITFADSSLNGPTDVAIDNTGNAWITNGNSTTVTILSPLGAPVTGSPVTVSSNPSDHPSFIALDASNNAWVTLPSANIAKIAGTTATDYTVDSSPAAIAFNSTGDVFVAIPGTHTVDRLNTSGTSVATYTLTGATPIAIVFLTGDSAWVADSTFSSPGDLYNIDSSGTVTGPFGALGEDADGIVADPSSKLWTSNYNSNTTTVSSGSDGSLVTSYTVPNPLAVAMDGSGNAWFADFDDSAIAELSNSGVSLSPSSTGYQLNNVDGPEGIAVDGAGDVWVTSANNNQVMELIGAATPVVTPIAASLVSPYSAPASKP